MNQIIELSYIVTLVISVACFTVHITIRAKNLTSVSPMIKWKSTTFFLLLAMVFNVCDFLTIYLGGVVSEETISWIYVIENMVEVGLAYTMICMERDYAGVQNPRWLDLLFVVVAMIILYGDSNYTLGPLYVSERVYVTSMIVLNMIPICLQGLFGFRYWKLGHAERTHRMTNIYMLIYNFVCLCLCVISTLSIVDSRTSRDFIWHDREIHVFFWLVFNVINFVFIWKSCVVDERDDMQRMQSAEQKMNSIIEKYGLSQRKKEIAELIFYGKNNKEIAGLLYLSTNTIKVHASNLYRKLGVVNRVQAAAVLRGEEVPNLNTEEAEEE